MEHFVQMANCAEEHKIPARIGEYNFEQELRQAIASLALVEPPALVAFLPLVIDQLLRLICRPPVIAGQTSKTYSLTSLLFLLAEDECCIECCCSEHGSGMFRSAHSHRATSSVDRKCCSRPTQSKQSPHAIHRLHVRPASRRYHSARYTSFESHLQSVRLTLNKYT